ncbi:MAG: SGNH hydrolase domain-containing protein [Actinomycetota bacterium]
MAQVKIRSSGAGKCLLSAIVACSFLWTGTSLAADSTQPLPAPLGASSVASNVTMSAHLHSIPTDMNPPWRVAYLSTPELTKYATASPSCFRPPALCSWGPPRARNTVVLFGDSHAKMWLPAIAPAVLARGDRLVLIWKTGCVAASVRIYGGWNNPHGYDDACEAWRRNKFRAIRAMHPRLIIVSERTSYLFSRPRVLMTNSEVARGLASTISRLRQSHQQILVIGDNPAFANYLNPLICLSQHVLAINQCRTPVTNPNPQWRDHLQGEITAARVTKALLIDPASWLCASKFCYSVIGKTPVYIDWSHLTAAYAAILSGVMARSIQPFL